MPERKHNVICWIYLFVLLGKELHEQKYHENWENTFIDLQRQLLNYKNVFKGHWTEWTDSCILMSEQMAWAHGQSAENMVKQQNKTEKMIIILHNNNKNYQNMNKNHT